MFVTSKKLCIAFLGSRMFFFSLSLTYLFWEMRMKVRIISREIFGSTTDQILLVITWINMIPPVIGIVLPQFASACCDKFTPSAKCKVLSHVS